MHNLALFSLSRDLVGAFSPLLLRNRGPEKQGHRLSMTSLTAARRPCLPRLPANFPWISFLQVIFTATNVTFLLEVGTSLICSEIRTLPLVCLYFACL